MMMDRDILKGSVFLQFPEKQAPLPHLDGKVVNLQLILHRIAENSWRGYNLIAARDS